MMLEEREKAGGGWEVMLNLKCITELDSRNKLLKYITNTCGFQNCRRVLELPFKNPFILHLDNSMAYWTFSERTGEGEKLLQVGSKMR